MITRPRRLRQNPVLRKMVRETRMDASSLIYPMFVREGSGIKEEIPAMEGVPLHHRYHALCVGGFGKSGSQKCHVFWNSRCKR